MEWLGYLLVGYIALVVLGGVLEAIGGPILRAVEGRINRKATRLLSREHEATLGLKYRSCINEYGVLDSPRWRREAKRFVDTVVMPHASFENTGRDTEHGRLAYETLLSEVTEHASQIAPAATFNVLASDATGVVFENRCANIFDGLGWNAQTTGIGADQGADVIARFDQKTLVLQCKNYSQPIGNKAVQEVIAAKAFYGATHAAVVGTAPFTEAAYQLAARADVVLLDETALRAYSPIAA